MLLIGCSTDSKAMEQIYDAENLAQNSPQRALEVINSVERSSVRGERDKARYALVLSEVMYHN